MEDNDTDSEETGDNDTNDPSEPDSDTQDPDNETTDTDGSGIEDNDNDTDSEEISDNDTDPSEPDSDTQDPDNDETTDTDGSGIEDNDNDTDSEEINDNDTDPAETDSDIQDPDNETTDTDGSGIEDQDDNDLDDSDDSDTEVSSDEDTDDSDDSDTELSSDEDTDSDSGESNELPECSKNSATPCKSGNLIWSSGSTTTKDWDDAKSGCSHWSEGRFTSGWRLPTISELRTLIINCPTTETGGNCGVTDQCVTYGENYDGNYCYSNGSCNKVSLFGNSDICSTSLEHSLFGERVKLWSSSYQTDNPGYVWYVNFNNGAIAFASDWIDDEMRYRCVHPAD